jgi:uncharacterized protein YacL
MLLGDISNVNNNLDYIQILTAVCIVEFIVIFIARKTDIFGKQLNIWYDKLGMTAVLLDVFISIIGLIITRYIFHFYKIEYKPEYFILIALAVQLIHDVILYLLFIVPSKRGDNLIMDIYKDYANENGSYILLADSSMILSSCLIAMVLKNMDLSNSISLLILVIYLIPYLVYSKSN